MPFGFISLEPYSTDGVVTIVHWVRWAAGDETSVELRPLTKGPVTTSKRKLGVADVRLPDGTPVALDRGGVAARVSGHAQAGDLSVVSGGAQESLVPTSHAWPAARAWNTPLALSDARVALGLRGAAAERFDLPTDPRRARLWWAVNEFRLAWETDGLGGALWIDTELLPHQIAVARHVLTSPSVSHVLADEVGLGKSVEALMIWSALSTQDPTLRTVIATPRALIPQWCLEVRNRTEHRPHARRLEDLPRVFVAHAKDTSGAFDGDDERRLVIIDHETLGTFGDFKQCDLLIVDEAHLLNEAGRTAAQAIATRARHKLLLTATPSDVRRMYGAAASRTSPLAWALRTVDPRGHEAKDYWEEWLSEAGELAEFAEQALGDEGGAGQQSAFWERARRLASSRSLKQPEPTEESVGTAFRRLTPFDRLVRTRRASLPPDTLAKRVLIKHPIDYRREERHLLTRLREHAGRQALAQRLSSSWLAVREGQLDADTRNELRSLGSADARMDALLDALASIWREDPSRKVVIRADYAATRESVKTTLKDLLMRGALRRSLEVELQAWRESDSVGPIALVERSQATLVEMLAAGDHVGLKDSMLRHLAAFEQSSPGGAPVLVAGDEAAVGLNLQGIATDLILFELPWRPLLVEQWIGRLDRLGRRADRAVRIHALWSEDSPDARLLESYERLEIFSRGFRSLDDDPRLEQAIAMAVEVGDWQPVFELAARVAEAAAGSDARRSALDLALPETISTNDETLVGRGLFASLTPVGFAVAPGSRGKIELSWPVPARGLDAVALRQIRAVLRPTDRLGAARTGLAGDRRPLIVDLRRRWYRRGGDFLTPRHVLLRELFDDFVPDALAASGAFKTTSFDAVAPGNYLIVLGRTCPAAAAQLALWSIGAADQVAGDEVLSRELDVIGSAIERRITADQPPRMSRGGWRVDGFGLGVALEEAQVDAFLMRLAQAEPVQAPANLERWVTLAEQSLTREGSAAEARRDYPARSAVERALKDAADFLADRLASVVARRRREVEQTSPLVPGVRGNKQQGLERAEQALRYMEQLPDSPLQVVNEVLRVRAVAAYAIEVVK
jgi:hypothetical protein